MSPLRAFSHPGIHPQRICIVYSQIAALLENNRKIKIRTEENKEGGMRNKDKARVKPQIMVAEEFRVISEAALEQLPLPMSTRGNWHELPER